MKKILCLLALSFGLCLSARAELHQVTALNTTTTQTIIIPGTKVLWVRIANVGANQVNVSADGGSSAGGADPSTGATGNGDPLAAGQRTTYYGPFVVGLKIVGVMAAGTTTLNVSTNAPVGSSVFPTN